MSVTLPPWIPIVVGALVAIFGVYRFRLFFRSDDADDLARRRGGLYGFSRKTHLLFGVIYLLAGAMLILSGLGIKVWPGK
jgi:hypothetical protein